MTRLHADPVEVRTERDLPHQFLWRGRLYVVRAVLACWTESGGWWRGPAVQVLHTGAADLAPAPPAPSATSEMGVDDREQSWWRVEADSGRLAALSGGTGVYDLCLDGSSGCWSLARVLD